MRPLLLLLLLLFAFSAECLGRLPSSLESETDAQNLRRAELAAKRLVYQKERKAHADREAREAEGVDPQALARQARATYALKRAQVKAISAARDVAVLNSRRNALKIAQGMREYNEFRGAKGDKFNIRPCLSLCADRAGPQDPCYRGCFRVAFKSLMGQERDRMIGMFPHDPKFKGCITKAYDFYRAQNTINMRLVKTMDAAHAAKALAEVTALGTRSELNPAAAGGGGGDEEEDNDSNGDDEGADPSLRAALDRSVEDELERDVPRVAREVGADNLLQEDRGDGDDEVASVMMRSHDDAHRLTMSAKLNMNAADMAQRAEATEAARLKAMHRFVGSKLREEEEHVAARRRNKSKMRAMQAEFKAKNERRKRKLEGAAAKARKNQLRMMAMYKRKSDGFVSRVNAHALKITLATRRTAMRRHKMELLAFLHEARIYAERCLRSARAANPTYLRSDRYVPPKDPLKDKRFIFALTLKETKPLFRSFLLDFRKRQSRYFHNLRFAADARRQLGNAWDNDDERPGHYTRDGQGPRWWLFTQPLVTAPGPNHEKFAEPPTPVPGSPGFE
jgi:hypothetical protein